MSKKTAWTVREKALAWAAGALVVMLAGTTIGWFNSYPPMATDATAVASIATAVGTFLLAFFAWKAWHAALATIRGQKSIEELAAMSDYIRALNALSRIQKGTPAGFMPPPTGNYMIDLPLRSGQHKTYADSLCHEVESSGSVWRAHHRHSEGNVRAFQESEQILVEAQEWWRAPEAGTESSKDAQFDCNADFAKEIVSIVAAWQVSPKVRRDLSAIMNTECSKFIESSPCRPRMF